MFSWQHIVWVVICAILITAAIIFYNRKKLSLEEALNVALVICFLSEVTKVLSVIRMVPNSSGTHYYPYIETNHLPLHMCSLQILLIIYVRFAQKSKLRENILAFMYPSSLLGAIAALAMPSIFSTSIRVDQAFTHPMAYQFFIFHSMLIWLSIVIARCGEVKWEKRHMYNAMVIAMIAGFVSLYVNSILASPTYIDGVLQSVDHAPNFFFTFNNPLNIPMSKLSHWYLYMVILIAVMVILVLICFYPLLRKKKV